MSDLRPFRGLRYDEGRAGPLSVLIAPPYDVISPAERAALVARSPYNIVALELPEAEPDGDRYRAAADRLATWQREGILRLDPAPRLYLYGQEFPHDGCRPRRRGLIGSVALTDWASGAVLPHERTMSGPKEDRRQLLRAIRTNVSPIFGLYDDPSGDLRSAFDQVAAAPPESEAALEDGQIHRVWPISDEAVIDRARRTLAGQSVVIADGHHRYETALEYFQERRQSGQVAPGDGFVLMVLVDLADPGLVVVPTHRVCREVPEGALQGQLDRLREGFTIEDLSRQDPAGWPARLAEAGRDRQALLLVDVESAYLLTRDLAKAPADVMDLVDTAVLESTVIRPILEPLFGAAFPEHITYVREPQEAIAVVRSGGTGFAGLLNPTPAAVVKRVAEAGQRMPQKTTYFYPKVSTGIVLRHLDLAAEPA